MEEEREGKRVEEGSRTRLGQKKQKEEREERSGV